MAPLKILICGGGIAGNALAFLLSKLGHTITVLERFPSLRTTGLQIDLRGHGIQVLQRMGLEDSFRSRGAPEQGTRAVDRSGNVRAFFPANRSGKGLQSFTTDYEIMRGDLCRMLFEENKGAVRYVFDTTVESLEQDGKVVDVKLANGESGRYDLVVGADGVGSRIRKKFVRAGKTDGFNPIKDLYIAYFTIPSKAQSEDEFVATVYMAPGGRGIMTRRNRDDALQIYMSCQNSLPKLRDCRPGDVAVEKEAFAEIFQGAGWQTEEIIRAMATTDDFYLERMGLVQLDAWSKGRVTLVGDAGYCPSANTGMGTTSAFVGAYVLAGEIAKHCGDTEKSAGGDGLPAALAGYEQRFRPFMAQVQEGVSEGLGLPTSAFGIGILNVLLSVASWMKWNIFGAMVLRENVKNWELPEYKELTQALAGGK